MRRDQKLLLLAAALSLLAWSFVEVRWAVIPLVFLNTHIHEMLHALAAVATGGETRFIQVFANGGGVTATAGGSPLVVSSAGYVGASALGGALIYFARDPVRARRTLIVLGSVLGVGMLLWLRGDGVGWATGAGWVAACFALARWLKGLAVVFAAQFLGIQQCLTSLQALLVLVNASVAPDQPSDAVNLAKITPIPALGWAIGWGVLSLLILFVAIRAAWKARVPVASRQTSQAA